MILESLSGNRAVGFYRGIVKKHLSHGRCKIYIPSIYDKSYLDDIDSLPSALPATPLFAGTNEGNGCFSYPNIDSIVWCFFENDDVNYPVFFAATLGGEDAFGQYDLIKSAATSFNDNKKSLEAISPRHLITSGKTHIEWYENGKISAIVEDPIRTQCSAKYTDYELATDNISANLSNELSNVNISAIYLNKLSNIDCQLVLDNNANAHGELSTSTHWYDIVNKKSEDGKKTESGTISTDNRNIMNNNGSIYIGTISSMILSKNDLDALEQSSYDNKVNNHYKLYVPGIVNEDVKLESKTNKKSTTLIDNSQIKSESTRVMDIYATDKIRSELHKQLNTVDITKALNVNLTSDLENEFSMLDEGHLDLHSIYNVNVLSTSNGQAYSKKHDANAKININTDQNTDIITNNSLTLIDTLKQLNVISSLTNLYYMHDEGAIESSSEKNLLINNLSTSTILKILGIGKLQFDTDGKFLNLTKYNSLTTVNNNSSILIDNDTTFKMNSNPDATASLVSTGNKKVNGSPIVDALYSNIVNTTTSIANIQIVDNIVKTECVDNKNAKTGNIEIHVLNKKSSTHCTIMMDLSGKMLITTTDDLTITTTNTVNVNTKTTTVNTNTTTINSPGGISMVGNTTIAGTLDVTLNITSAADVIASNCTLNTHVHPVPPHCPGPGMTAPGV